MITKKKILFFPNHEPDQYVKLADELVKRLPGIEPIFFLLNKEETFKYKNFSYESLVQGINSLEMTSNDNDFGCTLNELCALDRLHKKNVNKKLILNKFRHAFKDLLMKEKIEAVFGNAVSDSITFSAFSLCKKLNINYFFIANTRFKNYFHLTRNLDGSIDQSYGLNNFTREDTYNFLVSMISEQLLPNYASDPSMLISKSLLSKFNSFIGLTKLRLNNRNIYLNSSKPIFLAIHDELLRRSSYREYLQNLNQITDIKDKKYLFFPLHLHPESSTLIWGRWLHDQLEILRMISRSLPSDVYLVVKEHKVAIGRHEKGFYNSISRLPNTILVNHDINPHELIRDSIGVATISGTAGLEALCHGKPVLMFGDVCYKNIPNVIRGLDISKMKDYVSEMIEGKFLTLSENKGLLDYYQMKLNSSASIDYSALSVDDLTIKSLVKLFKSYYLNHSEN